MIRTLTSTDIDRVAEIWLDTNIHAHHFISDQYWKKHFPAVKAMFAHAALYVYEDQDGIEGFIGLDGDYIAGLFVCSASQSKGIGKQLLSFVKCLHPRLTLHVYARNTGRCPFLSAGRVLYRRGRSGYVHWRKRIRHGVDKRDAVAAARYGVWLAVVSLGFTSVVAAAAACSS